MSLSYHHLPRPRLFLLPSGSQCHFVWKTPMWTGNNFSLTQRPLTGIIGGWQAGLDHCQGHMHRGMIQHRSKMVRPAHNLHEIQQVPLAKFGEAMSRAGSRDGLNDL